MMERNENLSCTNCGLCREICPVYRALKDEIVSPRSKNNIAKEFENGEKDIDKDFFYKYCNGCGACVAVCPVAVGFDEIKARKKAIEKGLISEGDKQMVENIKKYGNPFGKIENIDASKPPDKLYCC